MTINVTPRDLRLTVNGVDYTDLVESIDGGRTQAQSNGLIITTGTIVLSDGVRNDVELDNRYTNLWERGGIVEIRDQGSNNRIAVLGYSLIDKAEYDEQAEVLTISVICQLGLHNNIQPANLAVCVSLERAIDPLTGDEVPFPIDDAIRTLLEAAGIPPANIAFLNIPGTLKRDIYLTANESLIRVAGQLAYDNGYDLWMNQNGIVRTLDQRRHGEDQSAGRLKENLLEYQRQSSSSQLPPTQIIIGGTRLVQPLEVVADGGFTRISNSDVAYFDGINGYFRTHDRDNRTINTLQFTNGDPEDAAPVGYNRDDRPFLPGYTTLRTEEIIEVFEQPTQDRDPENCLPIDEGRILSRTTIVTELAGIFLEGYYTEEARIENERRLEEAEAEALANGEEFDPETVPQVSVADLVPFNRPISSIVEETWEYNTPPVIDDVTEFTIPIGAGLDEILTGTETDDAHSVFYRQQIREAAGAIYPGIADGTLETEDQGFIVFNPNQLRTTFISTTRWTLAANRRDWTSQKFTVQSRIRVRPEDITAALTNPRVSLPARSSIIFGLVNTYEFEVPRFTAPSFARFPAREQPTPVPYEFRINVAEPSFSGIIPKTYDLTDLTDNRQVGAEVGFLRGKFDHYRYKASNITIDLAVLPDDTKPMDGFTVWDRANCRTEYYFIDALSISINLNLGSAATFSGAFLGAINVEPNSLLPTPSAPLTPLSDENGCLDAYFDLATFEVRLVSANCKARTIQTDWLVLANGDGTFDIINGDNILLAGGAPQLDDGSVFLQVYLPSITVEQGAATAGGQNDPLVPGDPLLGNETQFNFNVLAIRTPLEATCNSVSTCSVGLVEAGPLAVECIATNFCSVTSETPDNIIALESEIGEGLVSEDLDGNDILLFSVNGEILV